jgi:hypothetical protein
MRTIGDLIGGCKSRQAEIAGSLAVGNAAKWETYKQMVGQYQGLQEALDILNKLIEEDEKDE